MKVAGVKRPSATRVAPLAAAGFSRARWPVILGDMTQAAVGFSMTTVALQIDGVEAISFSLVAVQSIGATYVGSQCKNFEEILLTSFTGHAGHQGLQPLWNFSLSYDKEPDNAKWAPLLLTRKGFFFKFHSTILRTNLQQSRNTPPKEFTGFSAWHSLLPKMCTVSFLCIFL